MTLSKVVVQLFTYVTLLVAMGTLPVAAQTFDEAEAEYHRGDFTTALRGFRLAAEQGEGIPENTVNAYAWGNITATQGITEAQKLKEYATSQMTPSQVAEAQVLAGEYWTHYVVPFQ